jgi:parallel beta-helix repeat protein
MNIKLLLTFLTFPVIANSTTFYVATNGSNTAPYNTWAKASTGIQTAINAASDSDTIIVGSSDGHGAGVYNENLEVNKQLVILSENGYSTTTVVASNSDDHVFEVTDNNVTINGFSIYGATGLEKSGIYLDSVDDCTISNNRCGWDASYKNYRGIHLVSSDTCTINNTTASYNSSEGILLASSNKDTLTTNTVNNNSGDGISLSSSSNNTLDGNTSNSNTFDGIRLVPSSNYNTLNNNTSSGNGNNGILLVASSDNALTLNTANNNIATHGIYLTSSSNNNTLTNNTANSNTGNGIRLENSSSGNDLSSNNVAHNEFGIYLSGSSNNTIDSNTMSDNDGRVDGDGIMLNGSSNNTISNNTANNDPGDGIEFYEASNNNVIGNTIINSGWGIRINYYSSNNVLSCNTVNEGVKGIILEEEHSTNNIVANNTTDNNSEDGIYLYDNTSNNILFGNYARNNDDYGIHLNSSSNNVIYFNNLISNTTGNVLSENSSTNNWYSTTTIYYDYNSGTFNKGYLGNYYSDGTHTGSDGIGGTYTIANDNDDDYQLIDTSANYSLQAWWLKGDNIMYCDDATISGGSTTISNSGTQIWKADHIASTDIDFSGSDTWTGQLVFTSAPSNGHTFTLEMGFSTDGSDFTPGGPDATVTGDGNATNFTFTTDANAFTVSTGKYLAFRITSNDAEYSLRTGGAWSFISSSDNSPSYAFPVELSVFTANVSGGIVKLNWQTETEINNYGFEVQKSEARSQESEWKVIGFVEGHGNSNSQKKYSFIDADLNGSYKFYYRLKQIDNDGSFEYSNVIEVNLGSISEYALEQNYPNPFNPTTKIKYSVPSVGTSFMKFVQMKVYDILGNEVATLVNEEKQPGNYVAEFDGSNLSSGVYFYKLAAGNFSVTKKMVLLR